MVPKTLAGGILFIILNAHAARLFVDPDGNDGNSGTMERPFATVQKAHDEAAAADTIYLRGGKYLPTARTTFTKNGKGTWFKVFAFPDDSQNPVFDGSRMGTNRNTWEFSASSGYWHIRGVTITGAQDNGILVGGIHITLENGVTAYCGKTTGTVSNQSGRGILGWKCSYLTVRNWDSHHNADLASDGRDPYEDADGFAILLAGPGCRFDGCRAWNNSDDGWDFYYGTGNSVELIDCWAAYNGYDDAQGTISGTPNAQLGNGNGFKLGGQDPAGGSPHKVYNCCAWKNRARGFDYNSNIGKIEVFNCTGWSNPWANYNFSSQQSMAKIRNCISFEGTVKMGGKVNSGYNSWDTAMGIAVTSRDFASRDDTGMFTARTGAGELPDTPFLHLVQGSDCENAGIDVGLAFNGSRPDLGCFEREAATGSLAPAGGLEDMFKKKSLYSGSPVGFSDAGCRHIMIQGQRHGMPNGIFSINGRSIHAVSKREAVAPVRSGCTERRAMTAY